MFDSSTTRRALELPLSRRAVIGKAAFGAVAAVALGAARTGGASTRALQAATDEPADDRDGQNASAREQTRGLDEGGPPPSESVAISSPPLWDLVRPLAAGSVLAYGWQLVELSPVRDGSYVATLQNARGRSHRVHLCRNDGTPQGIVYTRRVDLVVMNEGSGDLPTEENLAQAIAELAHAVAANETNAPERLFADLVPHTERVQRFAAAAAAAGPAAYGKLR